jgi:hypothetical protein
MSSASVVLVRQRTDFDCAVAALNTIAPHLRYRTILRVVHQIDKAAKGKLGLYLREVVALAARLDIDLTPRTATPRKLDQATGVLRLSWAPHTRRAKAFPGGHFVALHEGRILDPGLGDELPWREYVEKRNAQVGTLLERV